MRREGLSVCSRELRSVSSQEDIGNGFSGMSGKKTKKPYKYRCLGKEGGIRTEGNGMVKVITYGTFDLFHEGHYRLLQRAKALGDYLIVGVTSEKYDMERGKLNVVDSLLTRMENVKKTGFADEIIVEEKKKQKINDIKKYDVDIFTVGSDWTGTFDFINDFCKVVYLERTKNISSTMLRERNKRILKAGIIGTGRIANRFN